MRASEDKSSKPKQIGGRVPQPSRKPLSIRAGGVISAGTVGGYPENAVSGNVQQRGMGDGTHTGGSSRRPEYYSQVPSASGGIPNLISSVKPSSSGTPKVSSAGSGRGSGSGSGGSVGGSSSGSSSVSVAPVDPAKLARQQKLAAMTPAERQAYLNRTSVTVNIPHGTNPAPNINWGSSGVDPSVAKELNVAMGLQVKKLPLNSRQKHILHMAKVGQLKTVKPLSAGTVTTKPADDRANSPGFGQLDSSQKPPLASKPIDNAHGPFTPGTKPPVGGLPNAHGPFNPGDKPPVKNPDDQSRDPRPTVANSGDKFVNDHSRDPRPITPVKNPDDHSRDPRPASTVIQPDKKPLVAATSTAPVKKPNELAAAAAAQKAGAPLTDHQKHILHQAHLANMASQIETQRATNAAKGIVNSGQYLGGTKMSLSGGTSNSQRSASPAVPPAVKPKPGKRGGTPGIELPAA